MSECMNGWMKKIGSAWMDGWMDEEGSECGATLC